MVFNGNLNMAKKKKLHFYDHEGRCARLGGAGRVERAKLIQWIPYENSTNLKTASTVRDSVDSCSATRSNWSGSHRQRPRCPRVACTVVDPENWPSAVRPTAVSCVRRTIVRYIIVSPAFLSLSRTLLAAHTSRSPTVCRYVFFCVQDGREDRQRREKNVYINIYTYTSTRNKI